MGGCVSCCSSRCSPSTFDCVRVVHINGYIEEFHAPVTVGQVTGKPPKHVLCSSSHLLSFGSTPLLKPHDDLQPGRLYFLLPHTVFQSDSSPVDLAVLVSRLTAIGRAGPGRSPGPRIMLSSSGTAGESKSCRPQYLSGTSRARTWLPDLSTIDERSMERTASMLSDSCISIRGGDTCDQDPAEITPTMSIDPLTCSYF